MAGAPFWESGVEKGTAIPGPPSPDDEFQPSQPTGTINATFSDHPWDIAYINGDPLPGICDVLDGLTQIGIDTKDPDGKDGSTLTVKGYRPGPFEISCVTWTREQDEFLQAIEDKVWRKPNKKAKVASVAVDVYHPALQRRGITSGALIGITFPKSGPFDGAKTVHFKFVENVPPGKKRQTKTKDIDDSKVADEVNASASSPLNVKPVAPSKNRASLGPKGPPKAAKNGSN